MLRDETTARAARAAAMMAITNIIVIVVVGDATVLPVEGRVAHVVAAVLWCVRELLARLLDELELLLLVMIVGVTRTWRG